MALIFMNYRRSDAKSVSQRIATKLKADFGEKQVFIDVDDMQIGEWDAQIEQQIQSCRIFLVVIGSSWLKAQNEESGQRRLDESSDPVRKEIECALRHKKLWLSFASGTLQFPQGICFL